MLIDRESSFLLIVDVQERLLPAMSGPDALVRNARILLQAAARLGVPVVASEQYPQGLVHTVAALAELIPRGATLAKQAFSCTGDAALAAHIASLGRGQAVLCGIEAHVCVLQTAIGLAAEGCRTFVVGDATTSRAPASAQASLARMAQAGIEIVTTEMVLFEWLRSADAPEFRELSRLIR